MLLCTQNLNTLPHNLHTVALLTGKDAYFNTQMFSKFCVLAGKWQNLQTKKGVSADVTLHTKLKHVAIQFAHRGITHGERTAQKAFFKRK